MKISAVVKIKPEYTCTYCGAIREGTDTYTGTCNSTYEIAKFIDDITTRPPRAGMPVGWISNGSDGIVCDKCEELI